MSPGDRLNGAAQGSKDMKDRVASQAHELLGTHGAV